MRVPSRQLGSWLRRGLLLGGAGLLLGGCQLGILDPAGSIGVAEKSLIIASTLVMLLVVVPVIALTLVFAWRYRATNTGATYAPNWSHSLRLEIVVWAIPCMIILFLGILTWTTTHALDPYKPLSSKARPITIEVVALDWKWLFIYPDLGIATINQIAFPVGTPVDFRITSDSVMNSFFIPRLGSQIFAMAGMQTQLHLIADHPGSYDGLSANFSGSGFSDMTFKAIATTDAKFQDWVQSVRRAPGRLDQADYPKVAAPSEKAPVTFFAHVQPGLYQAVIAKYMGKAASFHSGMKED